MTILSTPPQGSTPSDYVRVKGTSHYQYRGDPSIVISNGQMANVRARELGYGGRGERQEDRKNYSYDRQWQSAKDAGMSQREFERQRNAIFKTDKVNDVSPNGDFAKFLVSIGQRDPGATYNVGETPKKRGNR